MITKAIIEELLDDGKQARVRIPFYDKVQGAADATLTKDLSIASTSITPGCYPVYNIGDIVFIAFEEDSLDKPVIIGLLYTNDNTNSSCDITAQSLVATVNSQLPENTVFNLNDKNSIRNESDIVVKSSGESDNIVINEVPNIFLDSLTTTTTWQGNDPYTQNVELDTYTPTNYSKIDIQADANIITQLATDGVLGLYIDNNDSVLTMYSIGEHPSTSLQFQVTITEVANP